MFKPLERGFCPACNKTIMTQDRKSFINGGMHFFVKLDEIHNAQFAICRDCFEKLTPEQANEIVSRQIVNYGIEIERQLQWYYREAVHYKALKFAESKDGLQT